MREWINGDYQLWDISDEHDSEDVSRAIQEQDTIGWEHFFRGRLSKEMGNGGHHDLFASCYISLSMNGKHKTTHYMKTTLSANEKRKGKH